MAGTALAAAMFFDDNPRYIQVGHDDTTESYVDMNSIQSIRYDPPYYIIKATVVTYDYTTNVASGYENKFFYNFKAQTVKAQTLSTLLYDRQRPANQADHIARPGRKRLRPLFRKRQGCRQRLLYLLQHDILSHLY